MAFQPSAPGSTRMAARMANPNPRAAGPSRMTNQDSTANPSSMANQDSAAGPSRMANQDSTASPSQMANQDSAAGPSRMANQDSTASPSQMANQDSAAGPSRMANQDSTANPSSMANQDSAAGPSRMANQDSTANPSSMANQDSTASPSQMANQDSTANPSSMANQDSAAGPRRLADLASAAAASRLYTARTGRPPKALTFNMDSIEPDPAAINEVNFPPPRPPTPAAVTPPAGDSWFSLIGAMFSWLKCRMSRADDAASPATPVAVVPGSATSSSSSSSADDRAPAKNCFRLLTVGRAAVGKSALVARFLNLPIPRYYKPSIEDFHSKVFRIGGETYQIDILDRSGHNAFPASLNVSYVIGDLFLLVFSMDCEASFTEMKRLRKEILDAHEQAWYASGGHRTSRLRPRLPGVPIMIAGNKADLKSRQVDPDEARAFAHSKPWCDFMEVSATDNENVTELYSAMMKLAGLPEEMAPGLHRLLPPTMDGTIPACVCTTNVTGPSGKRRRIYEPCGALWPNAQRLSLREEMQLMRERSQRPPGYQRQRRDYCSIL